MGKYPSVSIIIRTANRLDKLKNCINSLLSIDYPNFNIVVAMDVPQDGTKEYLEETYGSDNRFVIVHNKKHISSAYMYNLGVRHSSGEIIVFIDDDCIADRNCIRELVGSFLGDPEAVCVGGVYYEPESKEIVNKKWLSGCILAFKRSIFKKFSFDNDLTYSHLYDEKDLLLRIEAAGHKVIRNERAFVIHLRDKQYRTGKMKLAPLNLIYAQVKLAPLVKYYLSVLFCLFFNIKKKFGLDFSFYTQIRKLNIPDFSGRKKIWILYHLLLKIPLKAKIKYWLSKPLLS